MTPGRRSVALSWSGGKDSALALRALRSTGTEPVALLTTVTEDHERVSLHGVRRELLRRQAEAIGVELREVGITAGCSNREYEQRIRQALLDLAFVEVSAIAFADLFLEDVRAHREQQLAAEGWETLFPLWGMDTAQLAREFIGAGFQAVLVCVDPAQLDPSFVGRQFDDQLLADLPAEIDPCGENGEFHTFVYAGPIFERPIAIKLGKAVMRGGFAFQDLLPVERFS